MTKRPFELTIHFGEIGVCPVELAMQKAGFEMSDANAGWLSGYIWVDGVRRYHEALCPFPVAMLMGLEPNERFDVKITVEFQDNFMPANAPE